MCTVKTLLSYRNRVMKEESRSHALLMCASKKSDLGLRGLMISPHDNNNLAHALDCYWTPSENCYMLLN